MSEGIFSNNKDGSMNQSLESDVVLSTILNKLKAIEDRLGPSLIMPPPQLPPSSDHCADSVPVTERSTTPPLPPPFGLSPARSDASVTNGSLAATEQPRASGAAPRGDAPACEVTERIVGALSSLIQVRPTHYYISSFDPQLHDFDVWCAEVDRARVTNRWADNECLSRVASCLKGDAKSWLSDWVTNDRTWSNFKIEFRSLCPRNVDMATVLYDVMRTDSRTFATYAEYARRTLLRLNIVTGLSDDLRTAIVLRGITDSQIKAAATNAKLKPRQIVDFLSAFVKPKYETRFASHDSARSYLPSISNSRKREFSRSDNRLTKCYNCGGVGHKRNDCNKKPRIDESANSMARTETSRGNSVSATTPTPPHTSTANNRPVVTCSYCHKIGHNAETCFAKQRVETNNKRV